MPAIDINCDMGENMGNDERTHPQDPVLIP